MDPRVVKLLHRLNSMGEPAPFRSTLPLAIPGLFEIFPSGLSAGSLVEFVSATEGTGAWTLALYMARQVCGDRKILVIADPQRCFYPPAACKLGLDLSRALVLRTREQTAVLAALVQCLRSPAVGAVIGNFERISSVEYRRLQLAAETGGGIGFILSSATSRGPSFAAVRLLVTPIVAAGFQRARVEMPGALKTCRHLQIDVLRSRAGRPGGAFLLEIDDETGHVRVPASLATATAAAQPARASG